MTERANPQQTGDEKSPAQPTNQNSTVNPWKIGAVSYLNTLPLVYGVDSTAHLSNSSRCSLSFDLPSRLADQLATGDLDVALIPSIEVFQNPDYTVVSDACIACRGPVWSVKLLSRVPLESIGSLALDEGSRTSVALARILLRREFGVTPELRSLPIDSTWQTADADAVLIIGDRAMNPERDQEFQLEVDLGQWWYEQTGLPFVFAMWTARPGIEPAHLQQIGDLLSHSRDSGVENSAVLATENAKRYGLTTPQAVDYFQTYLHFKLGRAEREALKRFRTLAAEMQLAPNTLELQFHDC